MFICVRAEISRVASISQVSTDCLIFKVVSHDNSTVMLKIQEAEKRREFSMKSDAMSWNSIEYDDPGVPAYLFTRPKMMVVLSRRN